MNTRWHTLAEGLLGAVMIGFMVPGPVGGQGAETAALGCRVTLAPSADTDGDGLPDPMEAWLGTDYRDPDQDHDTMTDGWEVFHSLSPTNATGDDGPAADIDADGASNVQEYLADTDPRDETSCLRITAISRGSSTVLVTWKGGVNAWQRLESAVS